MNSASVKSAPVIFVLCIGLLPWRAVRAAEPVEIAGSVLEFALPACAAGMTVYLKDWEGAIQFGESVALSSIVTGILKYTVNEPRPNKEDNHSFPSGHTSISCASGEFMWKRYGWQYGVPMFALAAFVGYSRVESKHHYPRDIAAGAAIGFMSAFIFAKPYKNVRVDPIVNGTYTGVQCSGVF